MASHPRCAGSDIREGICPLQPKKRTRQKHRHHHRGTFWLKAEDFMMCSAKKEV